MLKRMNLSNTNRIKKKVLKRVEKTRIKNQKVESNNNQRLAKDSNYKKKPLLERKLTLGEKFQRAGEAPSVYSELMSERSKIQLKNYLFNIGFFEANITDSVSLERKNQVNVYYKVSTGPLTTINQFELTSNDSIINQQVDKLKERIFIKSGNAFDSDVLKLQRNSLTSYLQNNGFYTFNKEFIYYKIDSANLDRKVDITMGIQIV